MEKIILEDLNKFTKAGLWLAVVTKNKKIKVIAAAKKPDEALRLAHLKGFSEASIMMSASRYAAWTALVYEV